MPTVRHGLTEQRAEKGGMWYNGVGGGGDDNANIMTKRVTRVKQHSVLTGAGCAGAGGGGGCSAKQQDTKVSDNSMLKMEGDGGDGV